MTTFKRGDKIQFIERYKGVRYTAKIEAIHIMYRGSLRYKILTRYYDEDNKRRQRTEWFRECDFTKPMNRNGANAKTA